MSAQSSGTQNTPNAHQSLERQYDTLIREIGKTAKTAEVMLQINTDPTRTSSLEEYAESSRGLAETLIEMRSEFNNPEGTPAEKSQFLGMLSHNHNALTLQVRLLGSVVYTDLQQETLRLLTIEEESKTKASLELRHAALAASKQKYEKLLSLEATNPQAEQAHKDYRGIVGKLDDAMIQTSKELYSLTEGISLHDPKGSIDISSRSQSRTKGMTLADGQANQGLHSAGGPKTDSIPSATAQAAIRSNNTISTVPNGAQNALNTEQRLELQYENLIKAAESKVMVLEILQDVTADSTIKSELSEYREAYREIGRVMSEMRSDFRDPDSTIQEKAQILMMFEMGFREKAEEVKELRSVVYAELQQETLRLLTSEEDSKTKANLEAKHAALTASKQKYEKLLSLEAVTPEAQEKQKEFRGIAANLDAVIIRTSKELEGLGGNNNRQDLEDRTVVTKQAAAETGASRTSTRASAPISDNASQGVAQNNDVTDRYATRIAEQKRLLEEKLIAPSLSDRPRARRPETDLTTSSPEYLAFMEGEPEFADRYRRIILAELTLAGMKDKRSKLDTREIRNIAERLPIIHDKVLTSAEALTSIENDQRIKTGMTPEAYQDVLEVESRVHALSAQTFSAVSKDYTDAIGRDKAEPPTTFNKLDWSHGVRQDLVEQFQYLASLPGEQSLAASDMARRLEKEAEPLFAEREKVFYQEKNRSPQEIEEFQQKNARDSVWAVNSRVGYFKNRYEGIAQFAAIQKPHDNDLTRYLHDNLEDLRQTHQSFKKLHERAEVLLLSRPIDLAAQRALSQEAKRVLSETYLKEDKLSASVESAYTDVTQRLDDFQAFHQENPPKDKRELEERITAFRDLRGELAFTQSFSGPHVTEATSRLSEMDKSIGLMIKGRDDIGQQQQQQQTQTLGVEPSPAKEPLVPLQEQPERVAQSQLTQDSAKMREANRDFQIAQDHFEEAKASYTRQASTAITLQSLAEHTPYAKPLHKLAQGNIQIAKDTLDSAQSSMDQMNSRRDTNSPRFASTAFLNTIKQRAAAEDMRQLSDGVERVCASYFEGLKERISASMSKMDIERKPGPLAGRDLEASASRIATLQDYQKELTLLQEASPNIQDQTQLYLANLNARLAREEKLFQVIERAQMQEKATAQKQSMKQMRAQEHSSARAGIQDKENTQQDGAARPTPLPAAEDSSSKRDVASKRAQVKPTPPIASPDQDIDSARAKGAPPAQTSSIQAQNERMMREASSVTKDHKARVDNTNDGGISSSKTVTTTASPNHNNKQVQVSHPPQAPARDPSEYFRQLLSELDQPAISKEKSAEIAQKVVSEISNIEKKPLEKDKQYSVVPNTPQMQFDISLDVPEGTRYIFVPKYDGNKPYMQNNQLAFDVISFGADKKPELHQLPPPQYSAVSKDTIDNIAAWKPKSKENALDAQAKGVKTQSNPKGQEQSKERVKENSIQARRTVSTQSQPRQKYDSVTQADDVRRDFEGLSRSSSQKGIQDPRDAAKAFGQQLSRNGSKPKDGTPPRNSGTLPPKGAGSKVPTTLQHDFDNL